MLNKLNIILLYSQQKRLYFSSKLIYHRMSLRIYIIVVVFASPLILSNIQSILNEKPPLILMCFYFLFFLVLYKLYAGRKSPLIARAQVFEIKCTFFGENARREWRKARKGRAKRRKKAPPRVHKQYDPLSLASRARAGPKSTHHFVEFAQWCLKINFRTRHELFFTRNLEDAKDSLFLADSLSPLDARIYHH